MKVLSIPFIITFSMSMLFGQATSLPQGFHEVSEPFPIDTITVQKSWVSGKNISPENWKPMEQKDLASQLKSAKALKFQDIAPGPMRVSQGHLPYFCPNPDGKSWDVINPYRKKYISVGQIMVHDFGSDETKIFSYGNAHGTNVITPYLTDFHMKPSFYTAKKMIFPSAVSGHGLMFLVYDPAVNDFVSKTTPFDAGFELYTIQLGKDGKLYGMGQPGSRDGFQYFIFDPETYETKIFTTKGGQKNPFPYYRAGALHGDWLYTKYGHKPWHLVAFNFKTQEFRHLGQSTNIIGDHRTIRLVRYPGGVSGHIRNAAKVSGVSSFDKNQFNFWLVDGKIIPRTNDIAPWSKKPVKRLPRFPYRVREYQIWPDGFTCVVAPPEIKKDQGAPIDSGGTVAMPYRMPGQKEWKTLDYKVMLYPGIVRRLIEVNKDVLFAVDEGYGQHVFYDLKKKQIKRYLVPISPYAIGVTGDQLYVSGYPTFVTVRYDLKKLATTENPIFVGRLGKESDTHTPLAGLALGADGSIYIAGTTYARRRVGGGMAWYNPVTGKTGSQIMMGHRIFWLTSASEGKYILLSSKTDKGGKIFCWDVLKQKFIWDIKSPSGRYAGPIEEALPGLLMGFASGRVLYGLEAATGKILWRKKVPVGPITAFSHVRRHAYTFRRGPDGFIWASFDKTLARIDPRNAEVIPVGKMEPCMIAFAENGVYASGGACLRKITGLRVTSKK